jgi:hypothetical protein
MLDANAGRIDRNQGVKGCGTKHYKINTMASTDELLQINTN